MRLPDHRNTRCGVISSILLLIVRRQDFNHDGYSTRIRWSGGLVSWASFAVVRLCVLDWPEAEPMCRRTAICTAAPC